MTDLFSPIQLGPFALKHRVFMAPLTRMRATQDGNVPWSLNAEYYGQRASDGGLVIAEASQIDRLGQGYPTTPGLHDPAHVAGWRQVTRAVHEKGGVIFVQLWHVGRVSHSSFHGEQPIGPSAVPATVTVMDAAFGRVPAEMPRALDLAEIADVVSAYRRGAQNAREAGFDGVEVHGANGYLPDQFLHDGVNKRTDRYGGSIENRARFLLEIVYAAIEAMGAERVGVRLSPYGAANDVTDSDVKALFDHVIAALSERKIAYLHLIEPRAGAGFREANDDTAPSAVALFRPKFSGLLIGSGGYTRDTANDAIASGLVDAVAFGRAFIANPDLPERFRIGASLNAYHRPTFYGGEAVGYTDYPVLSDA